MPNSLKVASAITAALVVGIFLYSAIERNRATEDDNAPDLDTAAKLDDQRTAENRNHRDKPGGTRDTPRGSMRPETASAPKGRLLRDDTQENLVASETVTFDDLPIELRDKLTAQFSEKGYFEPNDVKRFGYDTYDRETIVALAKNGDPLAEFLVIAYVADYPEEVRREVAISAAQMGRTFGLQSIGSRPFDLLHPDAPLPVNYSPPTRKQMIEAYGMMLAAEKIDPDSSDSLDFSKRIALEHLSPGDIEAATEFANKLATNIKL